MGRGASRRVAGRAREREGGQLRCASAAYLARWHRPQVTEGHKTLKAEQCPPRADPHMLVQTEPQHMPQLLPAAHPRSRQTAEK